MDILARGINRPFHNDPIIRRIDDGQRNVGSARLERIQHRLLIPADDDRGFDGMRLISHQLLETAAFGQSSGNPHHGFIGKTIERGLGRMRVGRLGVVNETNGSPIRRSGGGDGLDTVATG